MKMYDSTEPESFEPIPVKNLGNQVIFVDGHTRAFVAFLRGFLEVSVYWEKDELDWVPMKSVWNGVRTREFTL